MLKIRAFALATTVAIASAAGLAAPATAGDSKGDFMIKAGVSGVLPNSDFDGLFANGTRAFTGDIAEVDDSWVPSLTLTYFVNKNIGVELFCCFAQHGIEGKGPLAGLELGETMIFPPILSLQYHFDGMGKFKPYVGAGVQFIHFFDESPEAIGTSLDIDSAFGFSLQGGVDVDLGSGWYVGADVRYTWLETEATITAGPTRLTTEFDLDPLIVSAHVGYRFNLFNRGPTSFEPMK